jgi:hypothetical protein
MAQIKVKASVSARTEPMATIPPLVGTSGRDCPQIEVPGANDGSLIEMDIFGPHAPTCRSATRRVEAVVARLPEERWGQVGGWRCVWSLVEVYCGRHRVRIYAANPGD